jgi:ribosomal-protein-alanine N-acetyltransferase
MEIDCETCLLRPLVPGDAPALAEHANDREVSMNLRDAFPHPYALADAESYIASVMARPVQTSFGIVVDGVVGGNISLHPGTDIERISAELGYWLGRPFWGRGVISDAVQAVTRYGFEVLKLHRVFAVPFARTQRRSQAGVSPLSRARPARARWPALRLELGDGRSAALLSGHGVRRSLLAGAMDGAVERPR